jgi:GNAT superfamily N-acetyltransferase
VPASGPALLGSKLLAATLEPYQKSRRSQVVSLLAILPELYPNGDAWLHQRLFEVENSGPRGTLILMGRDVVGVAIETPKSTQRLKLSTIYVSPSWRGLGLGRLLVTKLRGRWLREGRVQVYVTVAHHLACSVSRALMPLGFSFDALVLDRYGRGRHEVILTWTNERGLDAH